MTVAMDAALSGLKIAQQSLDVISNNIANASTPGYSRKILPIQTLVIQDAGHGVLAGAITRNIDLMLQKDVIQQQSLSENQAVARKYLDRIQDFSGPSEGNQSLSARISALAQRFTALSDSPDNPLNLSQTLAAAQQAAATFKDFSALLSQLRNQTEGEISQNVATVNQNLQTIASLNARINALKSNGQSAAEFEDQRDQAIRTLSQYMQVTTFPSDNGTVTVLTRQGQVLADTAAQTVTFQTSGNLLPTSFYPGGGVNGIFIDGTDVTATGIGGALGALIELRDKTLPTYTAQIDEMAQKLAFRMDQQGLRLFTDPGGAVPPNVVSPGIVGYVGFAALIQVNPAVVADSTLIRSGTSGGPVQAGSSEVINRVAQYAFGPFAFQQATGTVNISAGTVFTAAGLSQVNKVIGTTSITSYTPALTSNPAIAAGAQFTLTVAGVPQTITVGAADTALDLVNTINTAFGSSVASLNNLGQLTLSASGTIALADVSLGAGGIAALGFSFGSTPAQNPSFTIRSGTQAPVTITITPATTSASLLASLNAISSITASLDGSGRLVITPKQGGSLTLVDGIGTPLAGLGVSIANVAHTSFRQGNLGPGGTLSTGLLGNAVLEDFSRSVMTAQAEDSRRAKDGATQELSYLQTLDKRNSDSSGVNMDEELSNMIRIQSAYAAAAKMLSTSEKLLDDLLNAF